MLSSAVRAVLYSDASSAVQCGSICVQGECSAMMNDAVMNSACVCGQHCEGSAVQCGSM